MQSLSVIQRQLNKLAKTPGANKEFRKSILAESDLLDTQMGFFRRLDNIRRGLMVTQLATAVRNFESQVTRGGLNVMQKGLDAGMQNLAKKINPNLQIKQFADPLESLKGMGNIFRQFTPSAFKQVKNETDKILSSFPREQDRLFLRFSNDVVSRGFKETIKGSPLDKIEGAVQLLNVVNKGQEFITRRAIFQSSLAERIASNKNFYNGKTLRRLIEDNKTLSIRKEDIAGAVDDALEVTFAKNFDASGNAYEQFANKFIGFVNSIPFTGSLLLPFPRFLMNSVKFHIDFSPLGLLNFLSKGERMAFKKGDTSKISRAVLGAGLFGLAYWLRSQPYAGEKWYEFNTGKRTIDTRALNPFAAYLFVADMVIRKKNGTLRDYGIKDFAGAFLGVRAGTGLYLIDKIIDADALIFGTPMYRGTYTGLLKNVFDLIPNDALMGKPVGLIATGGSDHHYLALEHELKPLLGFFLAHAIPGSVYANNDHYSNRDLVSQDVIDRLKQLAESIVNFVRILPEDKSSLIGARGPTIGRKPLLKKAS